jgi:hypothetical protein
LDLQALQVCKALLEPLAHPDLLVQQAHKEQLDQEPPAQAGPPALLEPQALLEQLDQEPPAHQVPQVLPDLLGPQVQAD